MNTQSWMKTLVSNLHCLTFLILHFGITLVNSTGTIRLQRETKQVFITVEVSDEHKVLPDGH